MDRWQAQYTFWSSFGIPAYNELSSIDESEIPLAERFPHLTYAPAVSPFDAPMQGNASLWYRSDEWSDISQKADEIENAIGEGGVKVPYDNGQIWIKKPTSGAFAQPTASGYDDKRVKRILLTYEIEFI